MRQMHWMALAILLGSAPIARATDDARIAQAADRFETGDLLGARAELEGALAENPEEPAALYQLGRVELAEEDFDAAIDRLKAAVKREEGSSLYRTWLGRAYIEKLQQASFFEKGVLSGRAMEQLQTAIELDPENVQARIFLAHYYINAPSIAGGSKKKAKAQVQEILKHDVVEGNSILAGIHLKNEEYDLALEKLERCVEARPEQVDLHRRLAMLHQKLEQYDEAFAAFERALALAPDDPGALYQLGRTAVFSGSHLDRGLECLRSYLELEIPPGYPGADAAHWRIGMLLERQGSPAAARAEYEVAQRMNPDEDRYRDALEALSAN